LFRGRYFYLEAEVVPVR